LRAAGDCPANLQPLVELQYRGRVWHQSNGHDWTVRAFLVSEDGLSLDIAGDRRTEEAMLRALPVLAEEDLRTLHGRRLDADDFDKLSVQDPVRDLLLWLNNPVVFEAGAKGGRWASFRSLCQSEFGLDLDRASAGDIAGLILRADVRFDRVWNRFAEAPQLYPGLTKLLQEPSGSGQSLISLDTSRDPKINEQEESQLRKELEAAIALPQATACQKVLELEMRHGSRRNWVWARAGMSPWAIAMRPLARLAKKATTPVGGATVLGAASNYAESGWDCDAAAMEALESIRSGSDAGVMRRIVRTVYEPWLEASARHFQSLVVASQTLVKDAVGATNSAKNACLIFVDGLRFDVAARLASQLEARGLRTTLSHRLAALPTVTPTAKPAVTPIATAIKGGSGVDFTPMIQSKNGLKAFTAPAMRERMESEGIEVFDASDIRMPGGSNSGGWTECGSIDTLGHNMQADLPWQLVSEIERISDRVFSLLDAGWRSVRIVTDHGWLLLPGGLPKVDLPPYLAETKWARCAVVKGQPDLTVPVTWWHWGSEVRIASPPGIACFRSGEVYAHGGISLQECVVPDLNVERGTGSTFASIQSVEWRGMRCRIRVSTNEPRVRVDLRTNWKQDSSTIVALIKEVGTAGEVSLAVSDDRWEGAAASVVLLDLDGNVMTTQTTCVGEQA
jgi:hypothetical protein